MPTELIPTSGTYEEGAVARWARALDLSGTLPGAHAPGFTMSPAPPVKNAEDAI